MKTRILQAYYDDSQIDSIAYQIVELLPKVPTWTFCGPLGAGKTTLIGAILRLKGVKEVVTSPTFAYVNRYENEIQEQFFHFDLYRLTQKADFFAAGFDECLYQEKSWVFIEWPDVVKESLSGPIAYVSIEYNGENQRVIIIDLHMQK